MSSLNSSNVTVTVPVTADVPPVPTPTEHVYINTCPHQVFIKDLKGVITTVDAGSKDLQNFFRSAEKFKDGPVLNGVQTYTDMMYVFEPKIFPEAVRTEIDSKAAGNKNVILLVSTITLDSIKNAVKYYDYTNVNSLSNVLSKDLIITFAVVYSGTEVDKDGPICVRDGNKILSSRRLILV